jgi:hypothetical protein
MKKYENAKQLVSYCCLWLCPRTVLTVSPSMTSPLGPTGRLASRVTPSCLPHFFNLHMHSKDWVTFYGCDVETFFGLVMFRIRGKAHPALRNCITH